MPKFKIFFGLVFACLCLAAAFAAPGASALTGYTCHPIVGGPWSNPQCAGSPRSGSYGHAPFTQKKTATTYENDPPTRFTVAKLHGVANVEVSCGTVKGSGSVENEEVGAATNLVGSGKLAFTECTTNQSGCSTAKVAETEFKFEGVEGLAEEGVGLKFQPASGTKISTVTFEGTCGLHAFGAIPVSGSAIGTADGEPKGAGAATVFSAGSMESVTVGGEPAAVEAKVTITNGGMWIVTT